MKLNLFLKQRFKSDWIPVIIIFFNLLSEGLNMFSFPPKHPRRIQLQFPNIVTYLFIFIHVRFQILFLMFIYPFIPTFIPHRCVHQSYICSDPLFSEARTKISHMILFFLKAEVICVTGCIMSCTFLKFVFAIELSLSKVHEDVFGSRMFAFLCSPQQAPVSPENMSYHCTLTLLLPSQERFLCLPAIWREKLQAHRNGAVQTGCSARKRVA